MPRSRCEQSLEEQMTQRDERIAQSVVRRLLPYLSNGRAERGGTQSRLIDTKVTAAYLGVTPNALRKLKARGFIPFVPINRRVMYDRNVLDRWIARLGKEKRTRRTRPV